MSGSTSRTGSSGVTSTTAMRQETASPASLTTTITRQPETLVLRLNRRPKKKKVTWKEGTVDNEFLQKKSSKKCCIFHKDKPFDEDDTDDDDDDDGGACSYHHDRAPPPPPPPHHHHHHQFDGACSSKSVDAGD